MIRLKSAILAGASLAAIAWLPATAHAQTETEVPAAQSEAQAEPVAEEQELVVTGTRIANGFSAPTPVTVTSSEELQAAAPRNIADALGELPMFTARNGGPRSIGTALNQNPGQNLLNLRGLGANRNLVLLDGRRLVSSNTDGSVDVNMLPQNLVQRVEVVTGGASAAYGSDAVTGVANFILDTHFEGVKAEVQTGISTYGDLPSYGGSIAVGKSFFGGTLRVIASAEYQQEDGIPANQLTGRDWFDFPAGRVPNPVPGQLPKNIVIPNIRSSVGAYGGLITSGPLKGTQFLPGGIPAPFVYGPNLSGAFMTGGDGPRTNNALAPNSKRGNAFIHLEADLSDRVEYFVEGQYARLKSVSQNAVSLHLGSGNQFTIYQNNAYLPDSIRQRMIDENIPSFVMGRYDREFPMRTLLSDNEMIRVATGFKGKLGGNWTWDAYYTYGQSNQTNGDTRITNNRRLYAAVDAVVDPNSGEVVCRSTLSGYDPGCRPLNLFGEGSPDQQAIDWVIGDSLKWLTLKQHVAQVNISGDFGEKLQFGAGPIGFAAGLEYRHESADQTVDPVSASVTDFTGVRGGPASMQGRPGGYQFFNPLPLKGAFDIKEGYVELGIPVLKDLPFAKALDLTAAARVADYSTSGTVVTWKAGFNYEIIPDVRLRYTRSRDIRGPNILELYNTASQGNSNAVWHGVTTPFLEISSGNPNLTPEKADTETYGVVFRPSFIPGLQASVDYYNIKITDAIGYIPDIIQRCDQQGYAPACALITETPNNTLIVNRQVVNLSRVQTAGYDFELAYRRPLFDGNLNLRLIASHTTIDNTAAPGDDAPTSGLGSPQSPRWRGTFQARYETEDWGLFLQERYIDSALMNVLEVEGIDTSNNSVPAVWYTTLGTTFRFGPEHKHELFFTVNNLFDRDPPISVGNPSNYNIPTAPPYDRAGRYFNIGFRANW